MSAANMHDHISLFGSAFKLNSVICLIRRIALCAALLPLAAQAQIAQNITNFAPPSTRLFSAGNLTLSATGGASGNPVTFATSTPSVCTISGNVATPVALGTCTLTADQAGNASYAAAPTQSRNVVIKQGTQSISFPAVADKVLNSQPFVVTATASSGLPVTLSSGTPAICTVSAGANTATVTVVTLGICSIVANQSGNTLYGAAPSMTRSFTIDRNPQTITFAALPQRAIGVGSFTLSASASSGYPVSFSSTTSTVCQVSGSTVTLLALGSCSITANQAGDTGNYRPAPAVTRAFNVIKNSQTITFAALPGVAISATPILLNATATSNLPVAYAQTTPATCTVTGNNLTLLAIGTCTITANQAGDANTWAAAPQVTRSFTITKKAQTISFAALPAVPATTAPFTVTAVATSGLPVSFNSTTATVCTTTGDNGSTVTLVKSGTCTITANQAGDATTWATAPQVSRSFAVGKVAQTISFPVITPQVIGSAPFTISASASSNLPVVFKSNNTNICTVATANGVTTVSLVATGTCAIVASQAGDGTFSAAPNVTRSFAVTKVLQAITFASIAPQTLLAPPITVSAVASSGLSVTVTSLTTAICTVSGNTVTLVAAGRCSLRATQAGDATYAAAPPVTQAFTINKLSQTINFAALGPVALNQSPVSVNATASSGLPVTFSSNSTAVCTVGSGSANNSVSLLKAGVCSISASQAGNGTYNAAPRITRTFNVTKVAQTINFPSIANQPLSASPLVLNVTASSNLAVTLTSRTAAVCTVSGSNVTLIKTGSCTIVANQAGDATYAAAAQVSRAFSVTSSGVTAQSITNFDPTTPITFAPGSTFGLSALGGGSGNPVVFASSTPSVCTVSANTATVLAAGSCELTADQAGNASYSPATQVIRTVIINQASQTINFDALANKRLGDPSFTLNATASSGLAITYNSGDASICTVSGNLVTVVAFGHCTLTADQPGDGNYLAAPQVSQGFDINLVPFPPAIAVATGDYHSCAITATGGVKCWGLNQNGQLGDGSTLSRSLAVDVVGLTGASGEPKAKLIEAGSAHTCVVTDVGSVKCWGNNDAGQLGDGTAAQRNNPVDVQGLGTASNNIAVAIAAGDYHTCALINTGSVKCWGDNYYGSLGDGSGVSSLLPVDVASLPGKVRQIRAGGATSCALLTNAVDNTNQVFCWGQGFWGQLGIGNRSNSSIPVRPTGLTNPVDISVGARHACAVEADNTLKCWGSNLLGELGNDNYSAVGSTVPQTVANLSNVRKVDAGGFSTCSLQADQSLACSGYIVTSPASPVQILGLGSPAIAVSVGNSSACVVEQNGAVECWYENGYGQLGDGSTDGRPEPHPVAGFGGTGLTSQSISFAAITNKNWGVPSDMTFSITATASSGLNVVYTSLTPTICGVTGNIVTLLNGGVCSIAANQPGDALTIAAPQVTQSFNIIVHTQSQNIVGFVLPGSLTLLPAPNNTFTISVTGGGSGNPVVLTSTTPTICAVQNGPAGTSGNNTATITLLAVGTCTISADQAATVLYTAAPQLVADLYVLAPQPPGTQTITGFAPPTAVTYQTNGVAANTYQLTASGGASGNPVLFATTTPTICTVSNTGTLIILAAGICSVTADQAGTPPTQSGDPGYNAAAQVSVSISVDAAGQSINFAPIANRSTSDGPFIVTANAAAGLPVTFSSQTPATCAVTSGTYNASTNLTSATVTLLSAGQCTIAADQAGNAMVTLAVQVTQSFAITSPTTQPPATRKVYYIHSDHLNTPRAITSSVDNSKVWEWKNDDAFGNNPPNESPSGQGTFTYNLRFTGQYADRETGTNYNYFRDYDPTTGRYGQSDPIGLAGGLNTYAYALGNSLNFFDPLGLAVYRTPDGRSYTDVPPTGPCEMAIMTGGYIVGWKPCDTPPDCPPGKPDSGPTPPWAGHIDLPTQIPRDPIDYSSPSSTDNYERIPIKAATSLGGTVGGFGGLGCTATGSAGTSGLAGYAGCGVGIGAFAGRWAWQNSLSLGDPTGVGMRVNVAGAAFGGAGSLSAFASPTGFNFQASLGNGGGGTANLTLGWRGTKQ